MSTQRNSYHTSFGDVTITIRNGFLIRLSFAPVHSNDIRAATNLELDQKILSAIETNEWDDIPIRANGTIFQTQVWEYLMTIPRGETRSYRQIANAIGRPSAVRAIGTACGKNPIPIIIPCHRVIKQDGSLGGFSLPGGEETKKKLLEREGFRVRTKPQV